MDQVSNAERDAASLRILGVFFIVLGTLVLVATLWSLDRLQAAAVSVASGGILIVVGVGMRLISRRLTRAKPADESAKTTPSGDQPSEL